MRRVERSSDTVELLPEKRGMNVMQVLYIWRFRPAGLAELAEMARS